MVSLRFTSVLARVPMCVDRLRMRPTGWVVGAHPALPKPHVTPGTTNTTRVWHGRDDWGDGPEVGGSVRSGRSRHAVALYTRRRVLERRVDMNTASAPDVSKAAASRTKPKVFPPVCASCGASAVAVTPPTGVVGAGPDGDAVVGVIEGGTPGPAGAVGGDAVGVVPGGAVFGGAVVAGAP